MCVFTLCILFIHSTKDASTNTLERLFVMLLHLTGTTIMAVLFGNIAVLLSNWNKLETKQKERIENAQLEMSQVAYFSSLSSQLPRLPPIYLSPLSSLSS